MLCSLSAKMGSFDAVFSPVPKPGEAVRLAGRLSRTVGCDRQSVAAAMREYEREQTARAFPLQAKSYAMGFALHITAPPVPAPPFHRATTLPL